MSEEVPLICYLFVVDGCLSLGNSNMTEDLHPDVVENVTLKNKVGISM